MAGYSQTPLWKKLGYAAGISVYVYGAPPDYRAELRLPSEVSVDWLSRPSPGVNLIHAFTRSFAELGELIPRYRKLISPAGAIWISWPKKSSKVATDIVEGSIREVALPLGLVDIKVCAVDETWSGLKLVVRRSLRSK